VFSRENSELITVDIPLGGKFASEFLTDAKSNDRNATENKVTTSG
jgi:hypothetical protein